jgi:hypothetical protein
MYQISRDSLSHRSVTVLGGIKDHIDQLAAGELRSLHDFSRHFKGEGRSIVTVARKYGEYSVMAEGVFSAGACRQIGSATTSLAFEGDFDVTEAGLRIAGPENHREVDFLAVTPEQFLGFATMVSVQLDSASVPAEHSA